MTIALPAHEVAVEQGTERWHRPLKLMVLGVVALLCVGVLSSLGVWQMHRLARKIDLVERVNQRVHAAPVAAPGPTAWPRINAADDAYRHVSVRGRFVDRCAALVRAVTERGGGYWMMAPFEATDGFRVLINRGFVPSEEGRHACRLNPPHGEVKLTGLLRISEPAGGFLRANDPGRDRWYSRDVAAIAASRQIDAVAPYFIDAGASTDPAALPVGGLTVIAFPNNHLVYALTWFGLAIMAAGWSFHAARLEWLDRGCKARSGDSLPRTRAG